MDYSVWLPIVVSPAIMAIGGLLIIAIPETLEVISLMERSLSARAVTFPNSSKRSRRYVQTFDLSPPWSHVRDKIQATFQILTTRDVKLLLPMASLIIPVATVSMSMILRYIPLRFGWTLTQTGVVLGIRTGFNILVLLIILPVLGQILTKRKDSSRDLILARISAVLLFIGQAVFAAAPNIAIALTGLTVLTLGTGAPSLCRALLTRLVDGNSVGQLFSILAVCEMVGYLACGVGFGALYQVGLKLGLEPDGSLRLDGNGGWLALVFFVAAVVYFCCAGTLWIVDTEWSGDTDDAESVRCGSSGASGKSVHELRVLADGSVTRRCPNLESVSVKV